MFYEKIIIFIIILTFLTLIAMIFCITITQDIRIIKDVLRAILVISPLLLVSNWIISEKIISKKHLSRSNEGKTAVVKKVKKQKKFFNF